VQILEKVTGLIFYFFYILLWFFFWFGLVFLVWFFCCWLILIVMFCFLQGLRTAAKAIVATPIGDIQVYSDHFEMYCGMEGRLGMLNDLMLDCKNSTTGICMHGFVCLCLCV
jgi:hypothetical protein